MIIKKSFKTSEEIQYDGYKAGHVVNAANALTYLLKLNIKTD